MLEIQRRLKRNENELSDRVMQLYEDKKSLEKKIKLLSRSDESEISQWVEDSIKVNGYFVVVRKLSIGDAGELKRLGDRLISNIGSGIGILFDDGGEKPAAVVVVSADLVKRVKCRKTCERNRLFHGWRWWWKTSFGHCWW